MNFTLSDAVCAQITGLSEKEKLELIRQSSTAKEIPKEHKFKISSIAAQTLGVFSCNSLPGDGDKISIEVLTNQNSVFSHVTDY